MPLLPSPIWNCTFPTGMMQRERPCVRVQSLEAAVKGRFAYWYWQPEHNDSPPRCSWDRAQVSSVCQTTRRWRSCVRGEAGTRRYLWLWCRSGMARSPPERRAGAEIWWSCAWLKWQHRFSRVQPEDCVAIRYLVMDSLAHLHKLIDQHRGSCTISRHIIKMRSLKASAGQQFNGRSRSRHQQWCWRPDMPNVSFCFISPELRSTSAAFPPLLRGRWRLNYDVSWCHNKTRHLDERSAVGLQFWVV